MNSTDISLECEDKLLQTMLLMIVKNSTMYVLSHLIFPTAHKGGAVYYNFIFTDEETERS